MKVEFVFRNKFLKKLDPFDLVSIIATVIFSIIFAWFFLTLYNGYNFYIFDLGWNYHLLNIFVQTHILAGWPGQSTNPPFNGNLIYPLLSPLVLVHNTPASFIVFEAAWVSIGSYFVFKIAREETGSLWWAFTLQLIYFLFPSNYGMINNGPEFEILLPTFVLMSYYFFRRGNYLTSVIIGLLGALTSVVAPVIIAIFFILEDFRREGYAYRFFVRIFKRTGKTQEKILPVYRNALLVFVVGLIIIAVLVIITYPISSIFTYYLHRTGSVQPSSASGTLVGSIIGSVTANGDLKLNYLYGVLSGFLFIPLLSPYSLIILPYFIVIFYGNFPPYYDILNHFNFLFSGFLFLGLVYNIGKFKWQKNNLRKLMIVMMVAMFLSFLLYSPFSVTNIQNGTLNSELHVSKEDNYLNVAFSNIPQNASVFAQKAFPQLSNRLYFYTPGSYNNQTVDYAVVSPLPVATVPLPDYVGFSPFWAQHFLNNSSYGIYESISSVTIFKLNYHSRPILFVPLLMNYSISAYLAPGTSYQQRVFSGNSDYLPPGEYQMTYILRVNGSKSSLASAEIYETTSLSNGTVMSVSPSSISDLPGNGSYVEYTVYQQFPSYAVEYQPALELTTNGKLLNVGISVVSLEIKLVSIKG